jgi:hypothetical protein
MFAELKKCVHCDPLLSMDRNLVTDAEGRMEIGEGQNAYTVEQFTVTGLNLVFAAGTCAGNVISVRDCLVMIEMNVGFRITFYILFDASQIINFSHLLYPTWEESYRLP